jgi:hypothetical protein
MFHQILKYSLKVFIEQPHVLTPTMDSKIGTMLLGVAGEVN